MMARLWSAAALAIICGAAPASPQGYTHEDRVRRMLTALIDSDARPDQTTVAWQDARRVILEQLATNPKGELAVLARRAAARVQVTLPEPVFEASLPGAIAIDVEPAFLLPGLSYVAWVERALDGGLWEALGWATYAEGGGCGTVLSRALPPYAWQPGMHRLDLRAAIALLPSPPGGEFERPCGFAMRKNPPPFAGTFGEPRMLPTITYGVYVDSPAEMDLEQLADEEMNNRARQFIDLARGVSASRLDAALPNVPLEDWLDTTIGSFWRLTSDAQWRVEECHPRPPNRPPSLRRTICAVLYAPVSADRFLELRIVTATVAVREDGIVWEVQRPALVGAMVNGYSDSHDLARLGDLPSKFALRKETWLGIDLAFVPDSFTVNVPAPREGAVATLRVVVANSGTRDATRAHVRLLLRPCYELEPSVEAEFFPSVPAGKRAAVTWKARLPAGIAWTVVARVQPDYNGPRPILYDPAEANTHAALAIGSCPITNDPGDRSIPPAN